MNEMNLNLPKTMLEQNATVLMKKPWTPNQYQNIKLIENQELSVRRPKNEKQISAV